MHNILDYMVVIVDNEGKIFKYPFEFGKRHQDYLDEFSKIKGYEYSNLNYIYNLNNSIIYHLGNGFVVMYLHSNLNQEQLYALDYIENWLNDVKYLEVDKGIGSKKIEYTFKENVRENFSNIVLQSYYTTKKR